ncbi:MULTISPECIES: LysR family transcriptional regulator [unclassified Streptomyces]|uniref:LysR family transcriptional regulator n=1 Tax=unclassified Streptomyces TaxID=2593676 RepID=UPI001655F6E9|nr:LysR family transcriptional regulator [Streptomyces sp. CB02980]MCB8905590.1 LysR family transcriptional regulator [Streptomyces sp. CB02980]
MLERYELETFLTLAEELHFGRTGERLGVSTGRVSQTVKKLERRVGTPLFARTSRSVVLTPVGLRLYEDLLPAYEQLRTALERATEAGRGVHGRLRAGFGTPWDAELLTAAADALLARRPGCEITVREVPLDGGVRPLQDGELDIQLAAFPVREPELTTGPVAVREDRVLLLPAAHPLAGRPSLGLEDLAELPLITTGGAHPRHWLDHHYPRHTPSGAAIPRGPVAATWQEVLSHVTAGRGVTPGAARGARYHPRPGIAYVPLRDAPPLEYGLVWPTAADSALIRAFVAAVGTVPEA